MKLAEVFTNIKDAKKFIEDNKIEDYFLVVITNEIGTMTTPGNIDFLRNNIPSPQEKYIKEIIVRWDEDVTKS